MNLALIRRILLYRFGLLQRCEFSSNQSINGLSHAHCYLIVNLNIGTSFVGIGPVRPLIADILILKAQIGIHLETRALALWPKQILEAQRINKR